MSFASGGEFLCVSRSLGMICDCGDLGPVTMPFAAFHFREGASE